MPYVLRDFLAGHGVHRLTEHQQQKSGKRDASSHFANLVIGAGCQALPISTFPFQA